MFYTGVGSRKQNDKQAADIWHIGEQLAELGYTVRSGNAEGADKLFQESAGGKAQVFLPYEGFNKPYIGRTYLVPEEPKEWALDFLIDSGIYPTIRKQSQSVQNFHARNVFQVFGLPNEKHSDFCVYSAPESGYGEVRGGTRTAVETARLLDIPTFNLRIPEERIELVEFLCTLEKMD